MKRFLYGLLGLIVLILGFGFAAKNAAITNLNYYFGIHWTAPLSLMLLITFTAGAACGFLATLRMVIRMQRELVQARREIRQMEQELINLRSLPIKDVL